MKKSISLLLAANVIAGIGSIGGAFAAQTAMVTATGFSACKGVTLVKSDDEATALESANPTCRAAENPLLGTNFLSVTDATSKLDIDYLWKSMLHDQYIPDLQSKLSYWGDVKKCLGAESCTEHDSIKQAYGQLVRKLRIDLALANIAENHGKAELGKFSSSEIKKVEDKLPNIFPSAVLGDLTPDEKNEVQARASGEDLKTIQKQARSQYLKDLLGGVNHGLYLLAFLPSPNDSKTPAQASWSPKQWDQTIGELESHAQEELGRVSKLANMDPKDFPVPPFSPDEFARLHYEMDKYLSKPGNYKECGDAEAAATWMSRDQKWNMAASFAAFAVAGGGGAGAEMLASRAGMVAKLGALGSTAVAATGGTLGAVMTYDSVEAENKNAHAMLADVEKIGVEQGKEVDTQSEQAAEAAMKANDHAVRNAVLGNAAMIVGGGVVVKGGAALIGVATKAIAKAMTVSPEGKAAITKLILMSEDPEALVTALKKAKGTQAQRQALLSNLQDSDDAVEAQKILKLHFDAYKKSFKPEEIDDIAGAVSEAVQGKKADWLAKHGCVGLSATQCDQAATEDAAKTTDTFLKKAEKECGVEGGKGA